MEGGSYQAAVISGSPRATNPPEQSGGPTWTETKNLCDSVDNQILWAVMITRLLLKAPERPRSRIDYNTSHHGFWVL
ncbi:hypothetical protein RSAG8_10997, partial [Rhizoctonia solani AG-8 WAC10335]